MTDSLGQDLVTALASIVVTYLAEAEVNEYPYCVYDRVIREKRTKDGVYDIQSELQLDIVADDYDTAKTKADAVRAAVEGLGSKYRIVFMSAEPICTEGVWDYRIDYNIHQIS